MITPGIPALFGELKIEPVSLPLEAYAPGSRGDVRKNHRDWVRAAIKKGEAELAEANATGVAPWSATDHDRVVGFHRCGS